jgi:hypothetical protein
MWGSSPAHATWVYCVQGRSRHRSVQNFRSQNTCRWSCSHRSPAGGQNVKLKECSSALVLDACYSRLLVLYHRPALPDCLHACTATPKFTVDRRKFNLLRLLSLPVQRTYFRSAQQISWCSLWGLNLFFFGKTLRSELLHRVHKSQATHMTTSLHCFTGRKILMACGRRISSGIQATIYRWQST